MKKIFWFLGVIVFALGLFVQIGCWKSGENNPVSPQLGISGEFPVTQMTPEVRFQFVIPGENREASPSPFIQAAEGITPRVTFNLIIVNVGNTSNPKATLSKTVSVDSTGKASAVFSGIPAKTVIGEVHIEGGKYRGFSNWHGALDLIADSPNAIEVSPQGSKLLPRAIALKFKNKSRRDFPVPTDPLFATGMSLLQMMRVI